jgi:hypothetical protein
MADETSTYLNQDLYDQFRNALGQADFNSGYGNQYIDTFKQAFKNLTGNDATTPDIANFIQQAGVGSANLPGTPTYSDISSLANNYIQQTYPQNVSGFAQQQQTDQLGKTQQTIQDLISKSTATTAADLTNPNSPTYQSFSGLMNNLGITPSSGAFQAGIGGVLGQNAANTANSALTGVTLPALSGIQNLSGYGLQQAQGQSSLSHMNDLGDFNLQAQLAQMLAKEGQPSGLQNALGMTSSLLNAGGNAGTGAANVAGAYKATWICTAMRKAGVLAPSEVYRLHQHLFPNLFRRFWKFMGYFAFGKILVGLANWVKVDWEQWRPEFYDRVIAEPDSLKALDLYENAFWSLAVEVKHRLRVKTLFLYDNPGVQR